MAKLNDKHLTKKINNNQSEDLINQSKHSIKVDDKEYMLEQTPLVGAVMNTDAPTNNHIVGDAVSMNAFGTISANLDSPFSPDPTQKIMPNGSLISKFGVHIVIGDGKSEPLPAKKQQPATTNTAAAQPQQLIVKQEKSPAAVSKTKKVESPKKQPTKKVVEKAPIRVKTKKEEEEAQPTYKTIISKKLSSNKGRNKKVLKYPSKQLSVLAGNDPITGFEVTKLLWDYIKKHNLQNTKQKKIINIDETLKPIFGVDQINMLQMAKIVSNNLFDKPYTDNVVTVIQIPAKKKK
ncbi:MAG: hypothetical protein Ta2E_03560 [Mycoplasmoidaceae bacterium]|nr:MAG: hypothetical protein Ta2E_03560 [Mycoplasmoidaceae bacterium]